MVHLVSGGDTRSHSWKDLAHVSMGPRAFGDKSRYKGCCDDGGPTELVARARKEVVWTDYAGFERIQDYTVLPKSVFSIMNQVLLYNNHCNIQQDKRNKKATSSRYPISRHIQVHLNSNLQFGRLPPWRFLVFPQAHVKRERGSDVS